jgi:hypothetical protein
MGSERKNRAIVGAAKAMLYDQDLAHVSYGQRHATLQSTYRTGVLTRCWGERLLRRHLQGRNQRLVTSGSLVPSLLSCSFREEDEARATAEKGIFVGYSETSKAYRVYIPALRKTVVRRDVKIRGG